MGTPRDVDDVQRITGFARASWSDSRVIEVHDRRDVERALATTDGRGVIARGLGRSYGDAAQNDGGAVIDCRPLAADQLELRDGTVRVGAGLSLAALLDAIVPLGWTLPVLPATRHITVGGAIAADVHGKNHRSAGTLGRWIDGFTLATPERTLDVEPTSNPELFAATTSGMGLTGTVLEARLRLVRCETSWLMATTSTARDLDDVLAAMDATPAHYSVAWVDAFAHGPRLGRGIVVTADPAAPEDLDPRHRADPLALRWRRTLPVPRPLSVPVAASSTLVRAFNRMWFRRAGRAPRTARPVRFDRVLMPLDAMDGWNRLYGRRGFVQYQLAVPDTSVGFLRTTLERLGAAGCWSRFTTIKRFGPSSDAPLSFPLEGWSLSLDIPATAPDLAAMLDALDHDLVAAGGRLYLAKDSRMRPGLLPAMYPGATRLAAVRKQIDPAGVLQSDLARRLGLV